MTKHSISIRAHIADEEGENVVTIYSKDREPFDFSCQVELHVEEGLAIVDAHTLIRAIKACSGIGSYDD